jgi:putative transposase
MERFHDKYRIPSARLQNWDYGWNGIYYVTICTAGHEHCFGKITDLEMWLSETGQCAHQYWMKIPQHFPFMQLDAFIVMPNHVHGILIIDKQDDGRYKQYNGAAAATNGVHGSGGITGTHNPMLHENLSRTIRWYKGCVTFESRRINHGFKWQERFYDSIIRSDESFEHVRSYIENNPTNWLNDEYYH